MPAPKGTRNINFDPDCLPAADTDAALEITGLRHAPLAAP